jgi:hypothetical protein
MLLSGPRLRPKLCQWLVQPSLSSRNTGGTAAEGFLPDRPIVIINYHRGWYYTIQNHHHLRHLGCHHVFINAGSNVGGAYDGRFLPAFEPNGDLKASLEE